MNTPPARLLLTKALLATVAAAQGDPNETWAAFLKLPAARQVQAAAEFVEAMPALPFTAELHELAAAASAPQRERTKPGGSKRPARALELPHEVDVLPRRVDYVFGVGTIEPCEPKRLPSGKPASKPGTLPPPEGLAIRQALSGCVPDADKALAVLLQRLDADPRADAFAAFLHSWRNDDESFYEALDRTAGTKNSVFFFDAMLSDFRFQFDGKGEHKLTGGLQAAHDALHAAFLSYRQYRGFREAVAWSLVLPPDAPLPARLQRYEQKVAGNYSLRQQMVMVASALQNDLGKTVDAVLDGAPPLPQPVWATAYDPYPAWNTKFQALQAKMIERSGSTDAFLAAAETERRNLAAGLVRLATERVQQAIADNKAH